MNWFDEKIKKWIFDEEDGHRIFFTSDTHFRHENIIRYCNRPFDDIYKHDAALVRMWNSVVKEDDLVFHLGDVGFGHPKDINMLLEHLNGHIVLVVGNHDWRRVVSQHKHRFLNISQQINLKVGKQHIILNHFPLLCFSGSYRRPEDMTWQLFGHVHSGPFASEGLDTPRLDMLFSTQYDVGVDNNNFMPVSYNQVKKIIHEKLGLL